MAKQSLKRSAALPKKKLQQKKTTNHPKQSSSKKVAATARKLTWRRRVARRKQNFLARRPHRSFRYTRRRDYKRSLALPGYIAFTWYVITTLKARWKTFALLMVAYTVLGIVLGTMTSQDTYSQMGAMVQGLGGDLLTGNVGAIAQAGLVSLVTFTGASSLTDVQKIYVGLMFALAWLTTVWLLREYLAGRLPRLRDGIYSSAAPLVSTVLVAFWLLVQILPIGLIAIIFSGLVNAGLLSNAFGTFLFAIIAVLLAALSLYWMTSTFIALVVVTLPGMYPLQAIRAAGDLVIGRRLRILYRIVWLAGLTALGWLLVMIPVVILDTWLQSMFDWVVAVPWVPVVASFLGAATVVWLSSYVYLLYRKVVDDDARPA